MFNALMNALAVSTEHAGDSMAIEIWLQVTLPVSNGVREENRCQMIIGTLDQMLFNVPEGQPAIFTFVARFF